MYRFAIHFRRTLLDGRVLLIGLPFKNERITDSLLGTMDEARCVVWIDPDNLVDRTDAMKGVENIEIIQNGLEVPHPQGVGIPNS